jgi:hypothetical protein
VPWAELSSSLAAPGLEQATSSTREQQPPPACAAAVHCTMQPAPACQRCQHCVHCVGSAILQAACSSLAAREACCVCCAAALGTARNGIPLFLAATACYCVGEQEPTKQCVAASSSTTRRGGTVPAQQAEQVIDLQYSCGPQSMCKVTPCAL